MSRSALHPALLRPALATAGAGALLVAASPLAGAHVTVTPSTTAAEAYSVLSFSVGHGCEGSPTTAIAVRMPEEILAVTPTVHPGWEVEKVMQQLDEPAEGAHGTTYTERVDRVVYTARTPLPDGYLDTFELQLQLTAEEGTTLAFPVVQSCVEGETAWTQTVAEGEEEPESPAPFLVVTAAEGGDHHGAAEGSSTVEGSSAAAGPVADTDGAPAWPGWLGLALGAAGLAAGGTALARSRR